MKKRATGTDSFLASIYGASLSGSTLTFVCRSSCSNVLQINIIAINNPTNQTVPQQKSLKCQK